MLRAPLTTELHPLLSNKFIIHEPHLISGTQIAGGLALPALFYFMLKSYDVTSWAAFIDRYGFPIRLGKYSRKATKDDITTLHRAVASIGADFGAGIPDGATIEIIESKTSSENSEAYQRMATWIDKQISKLVLGQTMTTDDGSSRAQGEVHEEVRQDIASADSISAADTLNSCLVVPYINLNFGEQERYPEIVLYKPDEQNIEQVVSAIEKLAPHGLTVRADEIRSMLGLSKPEEKIKRSDKTIKYREAKPYWEKRFSKEFCNLDALVCDEKSGSNFFVLHPHPCVLRLGYTKQCMTAKIVKVEWL